MQTARTGDAAMRIWTKREPGKSETSEPTRQVVAYVRGGDVQQRVFEQRAVANFCQAGNYEIAGLIMDNCPQHVTAECPTLVALVSLLREKSWDVVVPRLEHLSLDSNIQVDVLAQVRATGRHLLVLDRNWLQS